MLRAEVLACGSWLEFKSSVIEELFGEALFQKGVYLFRGQREADWLLTTSYDRWLDDIGLGNEHRVQVAGELLADFRRELVHAGDTMLQGLSDEEVLALAQHYGLPTRLLDWTESPYIGAFFAFADTLTASEQVGNVAVWALDTRSTIWSADLGVEVVAINPGSNGRLRNQEGKFTLSRTPFRSLEEYVAQCNPNGRRPLVKFLIPASDGAQALADLEAMGITPARMFPDFQGYAITAKLRQRLKHNC
jgi:hypothetical protein